MRGNIVPMQPNEWSKLYPWLEAIIPSSATPEVLHGIVLEPINNDELAHQVKAALALLDNVCVVYQADGNGKFFCKQTFNPDGLLTGDVPRLALTHFVVLTDESAITGDVPKLLLVCKVTMDKFRGH